MQQHRLTFKVTDLNRFLKSQRKHQDTATVCLIEPQPDLGFSFVIKQQLIKGLTKQAKKIHI